MDLSKVSSKKVCVATVNVLSNPEVNSKKRECSSVSGVEWRGRKQVRSVVNQCGK